MESLLRRASDLHSNSGVVRQLLDLIQTDDYSASNVRDYVEKDPALTIRVLATANSARYGIDRQVSNIEQAVAMLGRHQLRTIVLAFSVIEGLTKGMDAHVYSEYWKRSITTSLVADALGRSKQLSGLDDAFTAGLLVDVGVLVLTQFESEKYLPIFEQNVHGASLVQAERQAFGFDHAELGARLLSSWNFPENLVTAIAAHHDSEKADSNILSRLVRAGNLMPGAIWIADNESFHHAYDYVATRFDLGIDQFISLAIDVNELVEEEAKVFGVDGIQAVDCEALRAEAQELLQKADSAI